MSAEVSPFARAPRQPPQKKAFHPVNPFGAGSRAKKGGSCRRRRRSRGNREAEKRGASHPLPHASVRAERRSETHKGARAGLLPISAAAATGHEERGGGGAFPPPTREGSRLGFPLERRGPPGGGGGCGGGAPAQVLWLQPSDRRAKRQGCCCCCCR